jgi:predicted amidohydrolase YtcJ
VRHVLELVVLAAILSAACTTSPDIVLVNGRIYTGVQAEPWVEALAIEGDRIAAIGSTASIRARSGSSTRVIDVRGRLVIPGINDAHDHPGPQPRGTALDLPPLSELDPSLAEVLDSLKTAVARTPTGGWIFGGFGARVLDDGNATRFTVDTIAGDRLVMLTAISGHGTLFSTAALRHLGVKDREPDPPGGFFTRMPGGDTISGMAHEYAEYRLRQRVSMETNREERLNAFRTYANKAAAFGITSVQAMMTEIPAAEAARLLADEPLAIRLRLIDFPLTDMTAWRVPASRAAPSRAGLTVSGTKWILDGTPIERLMFLNSPYADRPSTRGALNFPAAEVAAFLTRARDADEQPMLHAPGDASIEVVLTALEASGGARWQPLRPRIEHADLLDRAQFERARRLGVVIVQNPSHLMDPAIANARLGRDRTGKSEALKSIVAAGIPLALGSDGPMNPYLNIMFATINATNPGEALTREQALVAYTEGSAFAEFADKSKGTLAAGRLADVAVLSQDIFKVPLSALPMTTSLLTIVGGRIVHEQK